MKNNFFKVLREGTHTSFQDTGFQNVQHIGITTGGAMDYELLILSNKILGNKIHTSVIEFSSQGPLLKLVNGSCRFVITGNVMFNIITKNKKIIGTTNQSYLINKGDEVDILATIKSNYGYISVEGGFSIDSQFGSFSTLSIAKIGSNNGNVFNKNQKIFFNKDGSTKKSKINFTNDYLNDNKIIRVIPGPQMNFFFSKTIKKFYERSFTISKYINRMGIQLEGNLCKSVISKNIISEGIIKGSIQITGSGNPIILMNDHPTIGGYPKIAIVIMADLCKISQMKVGNKFNFQEVSLIEAEIIYLKYLENLKKKYNNINVK